MICELMDIPLWVSFKDAEIRLQDLKAMRMQKRDMNICEALPTAGDIHTPTDSSLH